MDSFLAYLFIILFGILGFFMWRVAVVKEAARIPTVRSDKVEAFCNTLPEGFGYPYLLDNTGYAVNTVEKKIALHKQGKNYVYKLDQIRKIYERTEKGHELTITDRARFKHYEIRNMEVTKKAYEMSGIYVVVADIDHPEFQIRFTDEASQAKSWEILQQFREGTLQDYKEYVENRTATEV